MIKKPLDLYPGYYATDTGHIIGTKGQVLKEYVINSGYAMVSLHGHSVLVHRIVAYAFCPGYSPDLVVNHKNANRLDNRPSNLEWVTTKENIHDMQRRGKMNTRSARAKLAKVSLKPVWQCEPDGTHIAKFNSLKEAAESLHLNAGHISLVLSGQRHTTGGFSWQYVNPEQANVGRVKRNRK